MSDKLWIYDPSLLFKRDKFLIFPVKGMTIEETFNSITRLCIIIIIIGIIISELSLVTMALLTITILILIYENKRDDLSYPKLYVPNNYIPVSEEIKKRMFHGASDSFSEGVFERQIDKDIIIPYHNDQKKFAEWAFGKGDVCREFTPVCYKNVAKYNL